VKDGRYEVWYAIPSINQERATKCFEKWKKMGYQTCVLLDAGKPKPDHADLILEEEVYKGYYQSFNSMAKAIGPEADIIVTGGDDIFPDPDHDPQEIAKECFQKFPDGLFVMQPVGDKMEGVLTICASPWFGRGWLDRAYGGRHPVWPGYTAFFGDTELLDVARKLKAIWQRPDLVQYHDHWIRPGGPKKTDYQEKNDRHWKADERLFVSRKTARWPQMWPLPPGQKGGA
jgi:hypothetical protein